MAPELWEGKSPTARTDLYALGCAGFELLAGSPPYQGDRAAIRVGHLSGAVPPVQTGNATLRNLVMRLLAKDPAERPNDARAVLERLQRTVRPRSSMQAAIAQGLAVHAAEKSREAAERAAAQAAEQALRGQIAQARADLREIADDVLEDLQDIEPDAVLRDGLDADQRRQETMFADRGISSITLATADAMLRIQIWANSVFRHPPAPEDTMITACAVIIKNRRYDLELNAANFVYEQVGDRLGWRVYRFRAGGSAGPADYKFGPYGRTHGLKDADFFGKWGRPFMLQTAAFHPWRKSVEPLTSESLLGLFREAVDLRPPDSRTGLWP
ncbi:MAG: hypothetical protein ACRDPY_15945 [Streptosporangiaceae bacterium]